MIDRTPFLRLLVDGVRIGAPRVEHRRDRRARPGRAPCRGRRRAGVVRDSTGLGVRSDALLSAGFRASSWVGPTTPSAPVSAAAAVNASFFGPGVTVKTYTVTGATPAAIVRSVRARGPYSPWIGGRAEAVTQPETTYHFVFWSSLAEVTQGTWAGVCEIRPDASPAISQTYTVLLPKWTPPRGASSATIQWWAGEIFRVATHERTHVQNGITATRAANLVLASSTCANAESRLNAVWLDQQRHDCEFDMREYGKAAGLSLKSCTSQ